MVVLQLFTRRVAGMASEVFQANGFENDCILLPVVRRKCSDSCHQSWGVTFNSRFPILAMSGVGDMVQEVEERWREKDRGVLDHQRAYTSSSKGTNM